MDRVLDAIYRSCSHSLFRDNVSLRSPDTAGSLGGAPRRIGTACTGGTARIPAVASRQGETFRSEISDPEDCTKDSGPGNAGPCLASGFRSGIRSAAPTPFACCCGDDLESGIPSPGSLCNTAGPSRSNDTGDCPGSSPGCSQGIRIRFQFR